MNATRNVTMTTLTTSQCEELMNAVYRILSQTGIEVRSETARKIFAENGCTVEGKMVKIPQKLVEKAIETVPRKITLYDRLGNPSLELTSDSSVFGPGISCVSTTDLYTKQVRSTTKQDAVNAALICDALENVSWASALCSINEGNMNLADVYEVEALLNNAVKPFMFWAQNLNNLKAELEMIQTACGEDAISKKPHALCLTCPMDPLIQNEDALEQIIYTAERNIPMLHVAGISFGGNAPIYLAGAIVVGMADTLSGLVLSQLVNPGTPFIVGKYNDNMNFRTVTIERHNPEYCLATAATGDLFRYLNLICSANMGGDSANGHIDTVSSFDIATQQYTAMLCGTNLNIGMGGFENCTIGYLPGIVFANETIGFLKRIQKGLEINTETLAETIIDEEGPGAYYLVHDDTLEKFRDFWQPDLFTSESRSECAARTESSEEKYIRRTIEIIEKGNSHPLEEEKSKQLAAIIQELEEKYRSL